MSTHIITLIENNVQNAQCTKQNDAKQKNGAIIRYYVWEDF